MNLNTIRFEAKMETRRFLETCDREGILVIAGWYAVGALCWLGIDPVTPIAASERKD